MILNNNSVLNVILELFVNITFIIIKNEGNNVIS